ncbi:hypothetical protein LSAT2_019311, partial [Lamellibrachia satsuma]
MKKCTRNFLTTTLLGISEIRTPDCQSRTPGLSPSAAAPWEISFTPNCLCLSLDRRALNRGDRGSSQIAATVVSPELWLRPIRLYDAVANQRPPLEFLCSTPVFGRYVYLEVTSVTYNLSVHEVEVYSGPNPVLRNIALLKAAVQSGGGDSADIAVDGHFNFNSLCTTTSNMTNPWWSVDLKKQTIVTHVTVTSCEDLSDFIVGLADTPIDDNNPPINYTLCANNSAGVQTNDTIALSCQPTIVSGQFLFIQMISAANTVLRLSEVQVYTVVPNQARGRPLWGSSASDGPVLSGPFSCSECPSGDMAWWTDLGERQRIAAVYMRLKQNDTDGYDVTVAVTDVDLNKTNPRGVSKTSFVVCTVVTSPFTGLARCDVTDVYGRYVLVKARSETKLQLCEVEVFAVRECHDTAIATISTHFDKAKAVHPTSATVVVVVTTSVCVCVCVCVC